MRTLTRFIVGERYNSKQAHHDLSFFLYQGGASLNRLHAESSLQSGGLGDPIKVRLRLIEDCHRVMQDAWAEGRSMHTLDTAYGALSKLYVYADQQQINIDHSNVQATFLRWNKTLSIAVAKGELSEMARHDLLANAGRIIASSLKLPQREFLAAAGILKPPQTNIPKADALNLGEVKRFVNNLLNITESLNPENLFSRLPVTITLKSTAKQYHLYSGLWPDDKLADITYKRCRGNGQYMQKRDRRQRQKALVDTSIKRRFPLLNFRASAEFLLFIAATGMNREQVTNLKMGDFRFQAFNSGYKVSKYKDRVKGIVEFVIDAGYKKFFERYLTFRQTSYDGVASDRLFIILTNDGIESNKFHYQNIRDFLLASGQPWFPPQALRTIKANFIFRVADNADAEAMLLQHDESTFYKHYKQPNHQRAARQLTLYFRTLPESKVLDRSAIRGSCSSAHAPLRRPDSPNAAPDPNCANASGCLFCVHHKGVSSFDYIWGLATFLELKQIELSSYKRTSREEVSPLISIVGRINDVIAAFSQQSRKHLAWYQKALARVDAGDHHPRWAGFIKLSEVMK